MDDKGKKRMTRLTFTDYAGQASEAKRFPGDILYVFVSSFSADATYDELTEAITAVRKTGGAFKGIVLDLRGNPGGNISEAVEVAGLFMEKGVVVNLTDRRGRHTSTKQYQVQPKPDHEDEDENLAEVKGLATNLHTAPMVVVVDRSSASSAEILSGALVDNKRARLIGMTTFGKGVATTTFSLDSGASVTLTSGRFWTPAGHDFTAGGIEPSRVVPATRGRRDNQLEAALQELRTVIALSTKR